MISTSKRRMHPREDLTQTILGLGAEFHPPNNKHAPFGLFGSILDVEWHFDIGLTDAIAAPRNGDV